VVVRIAEVSVKWGGKRRLSHFGLPRTVGKGHRVLGNGKCQKKTKKGEEVKRVIPAYFKNHAEVQREGILGGNLREKQKSHNFFE